MYFWVCFSFYIFNQNYIFCLESVFWFIKSNTVRTANTLNLAQTWWSGRCDLKVKNSYTYDDNLHKYAIIWYKMMKWWQVKGQLPFDIVSFCINTFLAIIQLQNSGTQEESDPISGLVKYWMGGRCNQSWVSTFKLCWLFKSSALSGWRCVKHACFRICSIFAAASIFQAL